MLLKNTYRRIERKLIILRHTSIEPFFTYIDVLNLFEEYLLKSYVTPCINLVRTL